MEAKNVDEILVKDMQNQQAPVQAIPNNQPVKPPEPESASEPTPRPSDPQDQGAPVQAEQPKFPVEQSSEQKEQLSPNNEQKAEEVKQPNIDEYGNSIEKPRTYTEEEVQRMIRDRLSRGRHTEQQPPPTQQQVQKAADDFKADPTSDESWEVQLNRFIDNRIESRQKEYQEHQWKQQESQKQADFETRFNTGISKYNDFEQVVSKVAPMITSPMMLATRALNDPAGFIYGAAKMHPGEIERISRIGDATAQAMEIGRLHEKMVKHRSLVSNAPKPIEAPKGDLPAKPLHHQPSIDQRINEYGKQKQQRR